MPSYLDFDSTKRFRDYILGKTLQVPNGPQTFTKSTYELQNLSDSSNTNPGAVDTNRTNDLIQIKNLNVYKPTEYFIQENIDTLPRTHNLSLYFNITSTSILSIHPILSQIFVSENNLTKLSFIIVCIL